MEKFTQKILSYVLILLALVVVHTGYGQSVLNPNDTVITYNPNAAAGSSTNPNVPAWGSIQKWIRTVRLNWTTTEWKCYVYNSLPFRLKYPKSYNPTANDGKKYPLMIFFHGAGEAGPVTDNEYSLANGGPVFQAAVDNGTFDGYILVFQTPGSGWSDSYLDFEKQVADYMIANNKVDPFHIIANGLSAGGYATWGMMIKYPQYICTALPMSGISLGDEDSIKTYKYTPVWYFQGNLDQTVSPSTAQEVVNKINAAGGNLKYTLYPNLGHGTWTTAWAEPDFWPWCNRQYASNPYTLFGRTAFCPGDPINVTVGVAPYYNAYQWRKNGVVISGATGNSINVTDTGTYDVRMLLGTNWSDWSHTPVVISIKAPTVTPPIQVSGMMSKVIPSLSSAGVSLKVPSGYVSYTWQKVGDTTTIGTDSSIYVTKSGSYIVKVTELYGCSSSFSSPFTVVDSSGPNKPDAASSLVVSTLSQTSLLLNWSQNPNPTNNETGFEIYQATKSGGPYTLVAITAPNAARDTITGLNAGVQYYYTIRSVDNTGAAPKSNEASGTTIADTQAPTAPSNLTITGTQRNAVSLSWGTSTDNIGVVGYDIYVNGSKAYTVPPTQTSFTVYSLTHAQAYAFVVKARDQAGNNSPASNQVSGTPLINGLSYNYYDNLSTAIAALPDFGTLTPLSSGIVPNVNLTSAPPVDANYFAYLWQGYIIIPTTGTYYFRTTSDDGSRMWLGALNATISPYTFSGTPLISNDKLQGSTTVTSAAQFLTAGIYPVAYGYFQGTGSNVMTISWRTPSSGNSYVTVPNTAFAETATAAGSAPAAPSNLKAAVQSYKAIGLTWTDNSTNETGFEVWRSTSLAGTYAIIGTTGAGATSYVDSSAAATTQYFYQVRSINLYGASLFTSNYTEAEWKFNNNYVDSTGNNKTLTAVGSPTFDATNKVEGGYSLSLNGTNAAVTINNSNGTVTNFLEEAYNQRTIAFWMKVSSTSVTNRVIFDIGGSDNGLALLLNSGKLIAAVASNSVRSSISATYTSTGWNHIAVVYNGDSLLLYVNGTVAASTTSLSFHALKTTTNGSRIGQTNGTNAYNTTGTYYSGWIDDFGIYNTALGSDAINDIRNFAFKQSFATTTALPAVPSAPTSLAATAVSSSNVNLTWTNNGTAATGIQLYRSNNDNQGYYLLTTLPATATSYSDAGLFANARYYYKINAINAGGVSAYSNEVNATTLDVVPVITNISNQQARYGVTTVIPVQASSNESGSLTLTGYNLPAFASLVDSGNGKGSIVITPAAANQGTYNGIGVIVMDAFGGADTTVFNLAVNNNYAPTLDSVVNYTMNENDTLSIALNGHNVNTSDVLTITATNLPNAATLTQTANGSAVLALHPSYAAAGVYKVQVTVNDNNGLSATRTFTLTVNDKDPSTKIYTRVQYATVMGAPWNNMSGVTTSNLLDQNGNTTSVGVNFLQSWWMPYNAGPTTGNNSGVYPDGVLSDFWYFGYYGGPETASLAVTGLNPTGRYNLTFYAGSNFIGAGDNGTTIYTVGSQSVSLYVQGNTKNTVSIGNLTPDASGNITVNMQKAPGTPIGYLNALIITQLYDDGSAPAGAGSLTAQNVSGTGVQLNWVDSAYNETGYQVYRSKSAQGSFTQIGTTGPNAVAFTDSTVSGSTQYFYTVLAVNSHGVSGYSDTAAVTTSDRIPKLTPIADVQLKNNQDTVIKVVAVDDSTDHITLTASNLPSFATFTDNGNGTGTISVQPGTGVMGAFTGITLTATDNSDSARSISFNLYMVDPNVSSTYINITDYNYLAAAPWNNMAIPFLPYAGTAASNLTDDGNNATGVTVTLTDAWDGVAETGMRLRNGSNVYPEAVERTSVYTTNTGTHRITVTGLSTSKVYNFLFFGSHGVSESTKTNFTIGTQTVSLDGSYNSNKTVQINGVTTSTGTVVINVAKDASAVYGLLSSMVIEAYGSVATKPLSPADLRVLDYSMTNKKSNSIALQWQDRASNETGFEVYRANDGGSYAKIATLAAGTVNYTDSNLTANTTYNYTVRAVNGTTYSDYSAPVRGYTFATTLYVNFNSAANAVASPWNNLNWVYGLGSTWYNFKDENGIPTNIGMVQPVKVDGLVSPGVNTGNNSGIFPDKVMAEGFGMFPGDTTAVVLTGLNVSQTYELTVFASLTNYIGDNTTVYMINGQTCLLNSMNNKTGVLTIHGIVPDASGTARLSFTGYPTATFGLLGAMVVRGYTASSNSVPAAPQTTQMIAQATTATIANQLTVANTDTVAAVTTTIPGDLAAYPNPFGQYFTLSVPAHDGDKVMVSLMDLSGKIVFQQVFNGLYEGVNQLKVQPNVALMPSMYVLSVIYNSTGERKTLKLMKK